LEVIEKELLLKPRNTLSIFLFFSFDDKKEKKNEESKKDIGINNENEE